MSIEGEIFRSHSAPDSPEVAHYSHVIEPVGPGHVVPLSGIVGVSPEKMKDPKNPKIPNLVEGGAGPESEQILREIERQLNATNLSMKNVMSVRVVLAGPVSDGPDKLSADFEAMNTAYKKAFGNNVPPPTRDTIGGAQLLHGASVEMIATAWRQDEK